MYLLQYNIDKAVSLSINVVANDKISFFFISE